MSVVSVDRDTFETTPTVRIRGLNKAFGPETVLRGISLDVAPGEFVCLLGASGCGKTTLLYMIAGLGKPTDGTVEVDGARPALMFQEAALLPWLTAARNVELALRLRGVRRSERAAEAQRLLELVRLGDVGNARPHELSGGMRQRVALARALGQRTNVLLMDEPFAALDAITRDVLHEELVRVWQETQRSIVFVTHNVREAAVLGQRIVLLGSRPGVVRREWQVDIPQPRRIDSPAVSALAAEITDELRTEIAGRAQR